MIYTINKVECTHCGVCLKDCPARAIMVDKAEIVMERCIGCGHCYALCPSDAVEVLPGLAERPEKAYLDNLFCNRRSVRRYIKQSLSESVIEDILTVGSYTPTASNSRDWEARVVLGDEVSHYSKEIARSFFNTLKKINNPLVRWIMKKTALKNYSSKSFVKAFMKRMEKCYRGEKDSLFFEAPAVVFLTYPKANKRFGETNAALAAHQMILYAHSLGIESTMIGFAVQSLRSKKLHKTLNFNKNHVVGQVFTLGYPDVQYKTIPAKQLFKEKEEGYLSFRLKGSIL